MVMGFVLACGVVSLFCIVLRRTFGSNASVLATPSSAMQVAVDPVKLSLANHPQSGELGSTSAQLEVEKREIAQAQIEFVRRRQLTIPVQE